MPCFDKTHTDCNYQRSQRQRRAAAKRQGRGAASARRRFFAFLTRQARRA